MLTTSRRTITISAGGLSGAPGFPTLVGIGAGLRAQWQWPQRTISGELSIGRAPNQPASLGSRSMLGLATENLSF